MSSKNIEVMMTQLISVVSC